MKPFFFLLIFFVVFVLSGNSASGSINLTVQSENNKTLSIVNLQTFSTVATGGNNQTFSSLPYTNYEVRLLSNNTLTVKDTASFFEGSWSKMVYLVLMILIVSLIYYFVRGLVK